MSSYMMMGATSPVTVAGALAQGLAETMLALALTQIWRPGVPVVGGIFATQFSMRYMGPMFGLPEAQLVQMASVQLMRRLGDPVWAPWEVILVQFRKNPHNHAAFECLCWHREQTNLLQLRRSSISPTN